ncbi:hypothetical protein E2C01_020862 [Portunus trituberculatus]|uniref:Uncharacterized protein n=1 Tax=Portunus trituberculatus TaxID=210409 RepID=A0A5B7E374_PORTR|nr:hypothetical protein [Portunus trituberculatus]
MVRGRRSETGVAQQLPCSDDRCGADMQRRQDGDGEGSAGGHQTLRFYFPLDRFYDSSHKQRLSRRDANKIVSGDASRLRIDKVTEGTHCIPVSQPRTRRSVQREAFPQRPLSLFAPTLTDTAPQRWRSFLTPLFVSQILTIISTRYGGPQKHAPRTACSHLAATITTTTITVPPPSPLPPLSRYNGVKDINGEFLDV